MVYELEGGINTEIKQYFERKFKSNIISLNDENNVDIIFGALKTYNAYIVGESVLGAITRFKTNTLYIYIDIKDANDFISQLTTIYNFQEVSFENIYDANIACICKGLKIHTSDEESFKFIQCMIMKKDKKIIDDIIPKIAFSCYQLWFDGEKSYCISDEIFTDIQKNNGTLNNSYNDYIFKHFDTQFIQQINKFRENGFTINFTDVTLSTSSMKVELYDDLWLVKIVISYQFNYKSAITSAQSIGNNYSFEDYLGQLRINYNNNINKINTAFNMIKEFLEELESTFLENDTAKNTIKGAITLLNKKVGGKCCSKRQNAYKCKPRGAKNKLAHHMTGVRLGLRPHATQHEGTQPPIKFNAKKGL